MSGISPVFLNICRDPNYNISPVDPYADPATCKQQETDAYSPSPYLTYPEYKRVKDIATNEIRTYFIDPYDVPDEIKYEGNIVAWLLQRETGQENRNLFGQPMSTLIDDALKYFAKANTWVENPLMTVSAVESIRSAKTKHDYWQIRLALILLDHVDAQRVQYLFAHRADFFDFKGAYDSSAPRKENMLKILYELDKKASAYKDPALIAEIKFKIGILLNEQGDFPAAQKYFATARKNAKEIISDPKAYQKQYLHRVDDAQNWSTRRLICNYFRIAEKYRVLSTAHKIIAQTILLSPRDGIEITFSELSEALKHTLEAEANLKKPVKGEYTDLSRYYYEKTFIYKYFGEIYSLLDLERLRAEILTRMALLLKDPCSTESQRYIQEADKILSGIIKWKQDFFDARTAHLGSQKWKLHTLLPNPKNATYAVSLFSDWGADIIGNAYLAKARLLMATFPPSDKPKANLIEAKEFLDEAEDYLVRPDDYNFLSVKAEYFVRMNIEAAPPITTFHLTLWKDFRINYYDSEIRETSKETLETTLLPKWHAYLSVKEITLLPATEKTIFELMLGQEILEKQKEKAPGFVYGQIWLARVYMKADRFAKAEEILAGILRDPAYHPTFLDPSKLQAFLANPRNIDYTPLLTPQLKSSIYQALAELALEDENLIKAEELFNKANCWYKYNFYSQLGLADLLNWKGRYKEALALYQGILDDPRISINIINRANLGKAELELRRKSLEPGIYMTTEAIAVINLTTEILEKSDEMFMIERALESRVEALYALKQAGRPELERLRDKLLLSNFDLATFLGPGKTPAIAEPKIKDRVKASLYLKIADGFLFIYEYDKAQEITGKFEEWQSISPFVYNEKFDKKEFEKKFSEWVSSIKNKPLFKKRPALLPHYLLTSAEIVQRQKPYDDVAIAEIHEAGKIIFSLPEAKRDPYLSARVVSDLIDIYVNEDNFEKALALIFAAQEMDVMTELQKYHGILDPEKFEEARQNAEQILQDANLQKIFENKGLTYEEAGISKWKLFVQELQVKLAEILVWTRNFGPASELLVRLDKDIPAPPPATGPTATFRTSRALLRARILIAFGNIFAQWRTTLSRYADYKKAHAYFKQAESIIDPLTAPNPGQELILVKAELYLDLANLYRYGWGEKKLDLAIKYYQLAKVFVNQIKGNDDLMNYHLARIYLGYAKIAEERGHIFINSREYWPSELLAKAKSYYEELVRKYKFAYRQLIGELQINHQNLASDYKNPNLQINTTTFWTDNLINNAKETRLQLLLTEPLQFRLKGMREIDVIAMVNTDFDLNSGSSLQAYYAGLRLKPWFWLSSEADFKLGSTMLQTRDGIRLRFLKNPDLRVSLGLRSPWDIPFIRGLNSTLAADIFYQSPESEMDSYYGNFNYNFGRDFNNPFVQGITVGSEVNYFGFPYEGQFPKRLQISFPTLRYELDLKELDTKDHPGWPYDRVKVGMGGSLIYEYAANPAMNGKTYYQDNLGFNAFFNLMLNFGYFKVGPSIMYQRMYQDLPGYYYLNERIQQTYQGTINAQGTF